MINEDVMRKIRKCLALATSDNEGEAANALRQAQALMAKHGVTQSGLKRSALKEAVTKGRAGQQPSQWENDLVWMCCRAFGGKPLWASGPKGEKNMAGFGWWFFIAEGERAELIKYTYEVLVRQVLKNREKFSNDLGRRGTRVEKARVLDDYTVAYVYKLASKVAPFALSVEDKEALNEYAKEKTEGRNTETRKAPMENGWAASRGAKDGAAASFYAAAKGKDEQLKLEGS